jgi:hypothetical protein
MLSIPLRNLLNFNHIVVIGSIELESIACQAERWHLTQSGRGSQYRVPIHAALHVLSTLIESARQCTGLREGDRSMPRMGQAWMTAFAVAILTILFCIPPDSEAADGRIYRVHGQVIAVNIAQAPYVIVIKTPLTKHDDMTVGAKVTAQTRIVRKGTRIALQAIKVGEGAWLTYVKQRDGVIARTIQVQ